MFHLCSSIAIFFLVACASSLPREEKRASTEDNPDSRFRRALPRHVFECDGNARSRCMNGACRVLCDENVVVGCYFSGL